MPKINVYLPDELAEAVKQARVPVSAVCQRALEQAVRRVTAVREIVGGQLDDPAARLAYFTSRARTAVRLAGDQARAEGRPETGTGHLVAGLLAEGANLALRVLQAIEIAPSQVDAELDRRRGARAAAPGNPVLGDDSSPDLVGAAASGGADDAASHLSGAAAAAVELAVTEAAALGHNYVGCEHLLLGLIAEPDGTGGQVLRSLGAEQRLARRAVAAALAGYVHLMAQGRPDQSPVQAPATDLAAAIRDAVEPLVRRIARLERRVGPA